MQILNVAARKGNSQLATETWKLLQEWKYEVTDSHYNAVLQAFAISKQDAIIFRVLQVGRRRGLVIIFVVVVVMVVGGGVHQYP